MIFALALRVASAIACSIPTDAAADAVRYHADIPYRVVGTDTLELDLAMPVGGGPRPLIVIVHGGGWRAGDKAERLGPSIRRLAASGYAVASVNYRLTAGTANRFPAALEDVWCAVSFLRAKSATLHIDASRIVLAGESAGSQLAAMTALAPAIAARGCADENVTAAVRGFVGMYGIYDFLSLDGQPRAADAVTSHLGLTPPSDSALARKASPFHNLAATGPAMLLVHGTADRSVSPDQSAAMVQAAKRLGVEAELVLVPGMDHGFPMVAPDSVLRESSCALLRFLQRELPAEDNEPVRVVATDYRLTFPGEVSSGVRRLRLVNRGSEPHYAGIMRVDSGKTSRDFLAWRGTRDPRPGWLTPIGGIAPVQPGDSTDLVMPLEPGSYVVFCTYPSPDGTSHLMKGMVADMRVQPSGSVRFEPLADAEVTLKENAVSAPAALTAGDRTLRVRNDGALLHQMLVIALPPGVTAAQEIAWFQNGSRGARPGIPSGGVLQLPAGETVFTTVSLRPGRYLLLCTVAGHHLVGMSAIVEVR